MMAWYLLSFFVGLHPNIIGNSFLLPRPIVSLAKVQTVNPLGGPVQASVASSTDASNIVQDSDGTEGSEGKDTVKSSKENHSIRPLTQNWWPVTLASALDKSKPNPIALLGKKLVLWYDAGSESEDGGNSGKWSCLDDRCSHRFAPLSEGRIVTNNAAGNAGSCNGGSCLQCAYHGWEFNSQGECTRIPQALSSASTNVKTNKKSSISNYPLREEAGMIWIWADPSSPPPPVDENPLPISNLMHQFDELGMTAGGYMRDLPYGFEFLGENLADVSHLPFSHHSVGALNREDGRPVPLEMLSYDDKVEVAKSQKNNPDVVPAYQVRVVDAVNHDPEIVAALKNPKIRSISDPSKAVCTIGFFDPCHVRYHRNPGVEGGSYEIDLFMCPTEAGKSRVFLFTPGLQALAAARDKQAMGSGGPGVGVLTKTKETKSPFAQLKDLPNGIGKLGKLFGQKLKIFSPPRTNAFPPHLGHRIAHQIFDGDGIFLHKQGDRMHRSNLSYEDYFTPTSSDLLVNAFRRWLSRAADVTRKSKESEYNYNGMEGELVANSVSGMSGMGSSDSGTGRGIGKVGGDVYTDSNARSALLDRYSSHTANCSICQSALKNTQAQYDRLSVVSTALAGALGASTVMSASSFVFLLLSKIVFRESASRFLAVKSGLSVLFSSVLAVVGSWVAAKKVDKGKEMLQKEIQKFYFEDYVHAEKN